MTKCHGVLTENLMIFFPNAGKTETCKNSKLRDSRRRCFGDYMHVKFKS